ncbi:MAG: Hsp20/alpha crystallin family protein [bacterium]
MNALKLRNNLPVYDNFFNDSVQLFNWPKVNIKETKKNFEVEINVPGLNKEDIHLGVENDMLNISIQKQKENENQNDYYLKREFQQQSFSRRFTLPDYVDKDDIKANYKNGILKIIFAKDPKKIKETKKIKIK